MAPAPRAIHTLRQLVAAIFTLAPRHAFWSVVITVAASATEGVGLLLLVPLLGLVGLETADQGLGTVARGLHQAFAAVGLTPTLPLVLVVYVAVIVAQSMLRRRQTLLTAEVQRHVGNRLRQRLYRAIAGTEWTFFSRHRSSDAMHLLTSEIDRSTTAVYYVLDLLATGLTTIVYVGLAFRVSPSMTTLVIAIGGSLALLMRGPMTRAREAGEALFAATSKFYAAIAEHLSGMKLAKSYGAASRHADAFDALTDDVARSTVASTQVYGRLSQQFTIGSAFVLAILVYVAHDVLQIGTGRLLFLLFLFARLVPRLTGVYERAQTLVSLLPAFTATLEMEARCLDAAEPTTTRTVSVALRNTLRIDGVTFAYRTEDAPALRDVSMSVPAGTTVAIVGVSGSGKSTLADIVMGLLTPATGRVSIDGTTLDAASRDAWRARIGLVPQDTFLFHDTVRANLTWANPVATDSDLRRALRLAAAEDFVMALPQALETVVGDRGVLLSGGERQRLALARALLRHPDLLILDEATSSLDSENEVRIRQAIDDLHRQMTIIVITHRLSMVRGADLIFVLEGGQVVESGSWQDLLVRSRGRFRELCVAQGLGEDVAI